MTPQCKISPYRIEILSKIIKATQTTLRVNLLGKDLDLNSFNKIIHEIQVCQEIKFSEIQKFNQLILEGR